MLLFRMVGEVEQQGYGDRFFSDLNTRIRDLEEKQRLLKDRMLLISDGFIKDREKSFNDFQDMKKIVTILQGDNQRLKEIVLRIGQGVDKSARKEELMVLQRQFDLFRD